MSNEVLHSLLKEYEQKKLKAELDLEKRKKELYEKMPKLQQIEDELNSFAILTAKNILLHNMASIAELKEKSEKLKYEKACILHDAHLPNNYLKPIYECSICKDTGYISKENYKTQMCNCLKQKLLDEAFHKSNIANLEKENFDTFNEKIFSDEIDVAKYRFNISPQENIKNIKQKCLEFIKNFDNPDGKNLLFTGNTGLREDFYVKLYC
ncbi:MAG: hypothetical protein HFJ33_02075 [Clostridia bacterium]|nr:hypothetical protein [Clostridia bacterium]